MYFVFLSWSVYWRLDADIGAVTGVAARSRTERWHTAIARRLDGFWPSHGGAGFHVNIDELPRVPGQR